MKTVFAYTRVSTVRQGTTGSSLTEQKSAIQHYATQNSLCIKAWFEEQETAAKQGRPIFGKLLARMRLGEATGIIIHKIDRSARNLRDWADLGELVDKGFEIHLAHESLDLKSRGGRLAADIQAVVAADYVRNLRQEVLKGIKGRLKQGLYPWPAPRGYLDQGGGKPKILDPQTAPLVKRLFELYATGEYSLKALTREARIIGLKGRGGRPLSPNGISTIFHTTFYIGIVLHRPTGERYPGVHEPLISIALFDKVQTILAGKMIRKETTHSFSFRRMVRCHSCRRFLSGERQKGLIYYRCHSDNCRGVSIRHEVVKDYAAKFLSMLTLPPDTLASLRAEFELLMDEKYGDRESLRRSGQLNLTKCEERLRQLTDRYLDGDLDRSTFLERKERLVVEQAHIRERLTGLSAAGNPVGMKFELFFELQKSLYKAENLLSEANLARFLKETSSNFWIDGKSLSVEPKTAYFELANALGIPNCGATRCIVRSSWILPQRPLTKNKIKRLAKSLLGSWLAEEDG